MNNNPTITSFFQRTQEIKEIPSSHEDFLPLESENDMISLENPVLIQTSSKKRTKSQAEIRTFNEEWLRKFKWLRYDSNKDLMFCDFCCSAKKINTFTQGSQKKRLDYLYEHLITQDHENALEDFYLSKSLEKFLAKTLDEDDQRNRIMIEIAYFILRNNFPFDGFKDVSELIFEVINQYFACQKMQKVPYQTYYGFTEYMHAINKVLEEDTLGPIKASPFLSIMADESVDISKKQNLLIYARFLDTKTMKFETKFLKLVEVEDKTGMKIFDSIIDYLEINQIDCSKIICFGSDGASNMTGDHIGVISYFKKMNPWAISIHCTNHRLALAHKDLEKQIDYLDKFVNIIGDVYDYFSHSPSRIHLLHAQQLKLEEEDVRILRLCRTRWLSLFRCSKNLKKQCLLS